MLVRIKTTSFNNNSFPAGGKGTNNDCEMKLGKGEEEYDTEK